MSCSSENQSWAPVRSKSEVNIELETKPSEGVCEAQRLGLPLSYSLQFCQRGVLYRRQVFACFT